MTTKKKHAKYSDEFRTKALGRIADGKESMAAVAKDLKIHESLIYGWRKARMEKPDSPTKASNGANLKDAIILLQKAKDSMTKDLKAGRIKTFSRSQLLTLMALDSLTGGAS